MLRLRWCDAWNIYIYDTSRILVEAQTSETKKDHRKRNPNLFLSYKLCKSYQEDRIGYMASVYRSILPGFVVGGILWYIYNW